MRSIVNSAIVPSHVGHRRRLHVVDRVADARDARGRQVQLAALVVARADERVLPLLGAARHRRGDAVGLGPARRLERRPRRATRGTCRRGVGAPFAICVGDRAGRRGTTRSRRSCGTAARRRRRRARRARSPGRARPTRACRRAAAPRARCRCCRRSPRGRRRALPSTVPRRPAMPRTARACMPVTMSRSTWSGESSAAFSAAFHACSTSGPYFTSPKRSSHARERVGARRAPALDELLGRARAAEVLGDDRAVGVGADERARPRRRRPATRRRSSGGRRACRR